jgi:hypothetical protein
MPVVSLPAIEPLDAMSMLVEGRYRLWPGFYVAARADRLGFSEIAGIGRQLPWEAPVRRFEAGIGWSIVRNVVVKAAWQRNEREGGRVRHDSLGALQLLYWF